MWFARLLHAAFGDPQQYPIERRLYNITCVFMFLWTAYDVAILTSPTSPYPRELGLAYVAMLLFIGVAYYFGRFRNKTGPFVLLFWVLGFAIVGQTWFMQAGSHGTVVYVIFPSMWMLLIVAPSRWTRNLMIIASMVFVAALTLAEYFRPDLITPYPSNSDRLIDYLATVLTSILMMGVATVYYEGNYRRTYDALAQQKKRMETLTSTLRRYLPSQLVESLEGGRLGAGTKPTRARLTVFFSDIKDFTPLTDSLEPEDLMQLLNEYLTEMTTIAVKWGGTIDKFVGDAMMVLFGAPVSKGEKADAVSCVSMAVEIQRRMKYLQTAWFNRGIETPLQVRIGIHTGMAAVGDFGTSDRLSYTAIGGEVNLASRLQGISRPGGITISHATWALVKDQVVCKRRQGKVSVKGISKSFIVYDVSVGRAITNR